MKRREFLQGAAAAALVPAFGLHAGRDKQEPPAPIIQPKVSSEAAPVLPERPNVLPIEDRRRLPPSYRRIRYERSLVYRAELAISPAKPPANLRALLETQHSLCGTARSATLSWHRVYNPLLYSAVGRTFYIPGPAENAVSLCDCCGWLRGHFVPFTRVLDDCRTTLMLDSFDDRWTRHVYVLYDCLLTGASGRLDGTTHSLDAQLRFSHAIRYLRPIDSIDENTFPEYIDEARVCKLTPFSLRTDYERKLKLK